MHKDKRIEYKTQLIIPDKVSFVDMGKTYKFFCNKPNSKAVDIRRVYPEILSDFMKFLFEYVLKGFIVQLPFKCGELHIFGTIPDLKGIEDGFIGIKENGKRRYTIDWKKTNEKSTLKKVRSMRPEGDTTKVNIIWQTNEHTNGIRYKVCWNSWGTKLTNRMMYRFNLCRDNRLIMADVIKEGQEYVVVNPDQNANYNIMSYNTMNYFNDNA